MRHVTYMIKSCHTEEWVTSHVRMSHGTHVNESYEWVTYEWVISHTRMSHVARARSCYVSRVANMNESCHIYMWMSHGSCLNESCRTCAILSCLSGSTHEWVMSHMNESCHTCMSYVTYESVMSHMNESCHTWMSHVTYEWVMSHMNESCHTWISHVTYEWVVSHTNESCHIWISMS